MIAATAEESVVAMVASSFTGGEADEREEVEKFEFDDDFQTKIAALATRDDTFMRRAAHLLNPDYFENIGEATLVSIVLKHFGKYNCIPSVNSMTTLIRSGVTTGTIRKDIAVLVIQAWKSILKDDLTDGEFASDKLAEFARHQAVSAAILSSVDMLGKKKFEQIEAAIRAAVEIGVNQDSEVRSYWDSAARTEERADKIAGKLPPTGITTGIHRMDEILFHKGWGRKELTMLMGGAKAGKCVTRNTTIFTEDGMVEIGEYVDANVAVGAFANREITVLGMNGPEKTSHVYNSGTNPTVRVNTHRGFNIEGTLHHPMLTLVDGRHVWKRLDELRLGDQMVVQRGAMMFGRHTDIAFAVDAATKRVSESKRSDAMRPVTLPRAMTPELAEFMAMIIAEGYFGERGVISFTQKDEFILERFMALSKTLFGVVPRVSRQDDRVPFARIQSVVIQTYLEALGVTWNTSAHKTVPASVLRSPKDCVSSFLSALIGLECNVSRRSENKASFDLTMASEKLIKQVQLMLLNFGIVSRRTLKRSMATNGARIMRDYWRLSVSGSRNIEALARLGVYELRKNKDLEVVSADSTARDWIPGSQVLIGDIMLEIQAAELSLKSTFEASDYRQLRAFRSGRIGERRELTFAFAEKLVATLDKLNVTGSRCNDLRALVESGFCYDAVTEIENGESETVDLTVPGTHSFFANGLVSHNTTALINFAQAAALAGHNVLYVTCEVAARIIEERLDACITSTLIKDLTTSMKSVEAKLAALAARSGRLDTAEYPSGTLRPSQLRTLLEKYRSRGIRYDMVVVDYADIMAPDNRMDDVIENSKSVGLGLRAIAFEFNCAMLTATQTNREGYKATVAKAEHVSEDFNKIRTADLVISINKTEEEAKKGEARLYFAASRNQESGFTIVIRQNLAMMKFVESVIAVE